MRGGEEDIEPQQIPEGFREFVDVARETIAENTGVNIDDVLFNGFTLHFMIGEKVVTFEGMRIA